MPPRPFVRIASLGVAGATALFAAPSALAAAPALTAAPMQISGASAHHVTHGLHSLATRNGTVTSGNWSGYAATGGSGKFTSVSASWVQPSVNCSGDANTDSAFWVGLDGYSNSALEQTGTEADCVNGQAEYNDWWEVLPASETPYYSTLDPGDYITASVKYNGNGTFTMSLSDSSRGWSHSTTENGSSGFQNDSAEVIAEAPYDGSILPLANFGYVTFQNSEADGNALADYSPNEIIMTGNNDTRAQPGGLSGGTFADYWKNTN